jgi:hypothetical protein
MDSSVAPPCTVARSPLLKEIMVGAPFVRGGEE